MEYIYQKILDIVESEAACLAEFLSLLVSQQKFLVENDIDNLKAGVNCQQEIINQVKSLERNRVNLISRYSSETGLSPQDVTITSLARKADGHIADKLIELQNSLLSLHQKIEKAKRKNQFLIEHSMKYIEGTIRLIAEKGNSRRDYVPRKEENESLILSRTV